MTVELRPWTHADAPLLWNAHQENPDLRTQFGGTDLSTVDQARGYITEHLPFTGSWRNWAITIDGALVGNVGLSAIERRHGTAWAYYSGSAFSVWARYVLRAVGAIR